MTEPVPELRPSDTMSQAIEPDALIARKNRRLAWALTGTFLVLFGGTFGVAYVYLWLS